VSRSEPQPVKRPTGVAWRRKMRAALIDRDGPRCRSCGREERLVWCNRGYGGDVYSGLYTKVDRAPDLAVDHRTALADGGGNDLSNLQLLCPVCHLAKTVAEKRARRAAKA
jgi:5-methylcytosine-specific restriction endonuclease McrA